MRTITHFQSTRTLQIVRQTPQPSFHDMSHAIYYGQCPARPLRNVQTHATAPSSGAGKPDRRERVRRKAAQVAESINSLALEGNLASYNLRLPSSSKAYKYSSSSSSSSDSSESDAEVETPSRPAAASPSTTTTSAASAFRTAATPTTSKPSTRTLGTATISVCQGKACRKRGSDRVMAALEHSTGDVANVELKGCKCLGQCKRGPAVKVEMPTGQKVVYVNVNGAEVAVQLAGMMLQ
jgi:(2Fe-2S) ferredoxin